MNAMNEKISAIGVVPVIKLNHPERDAAALGKALCAGGVPVAEITFRAAGADTAIKPICWWARAPSPPPPRSTR